MGAVLLIHLEGGRFPPPEVVAAGTDQLFDRTVAAIHAGADVVVWNEGATAHGAAGVGLALVPSSDRRGIDPYHSKMAAVRGIEGGYSVVRPVRWATSFATDAMGRVRGAASYFEGDRILIATVPTTLVPTLYSQVGDVLAFAGVFVVLAGAGVALIRRREVR